MRTTLNNACMKHLLSFFALLASLFAAEAGPRVWTLHSPDERLEMEVTVGDHIEYSVKHCGDLMLAPSRIGMKLVGGEVYDASARFVRARKTACDNIIHSSLYRKSEIRDNYSQLTLVFSTFELEFRAYDSGAAYRFVSRSKKPFKVESETAQFSFAEDYNVYIPYVNQRSADSYYFTSFENTYEHIPLSRVDSVHLAFAPVLVEGPSGKKVCITESDLLDYPGMFLNRGAGDFSLEGAFAPYPTEVHQGGHNLLQGIVDKRADYIAECSAGSSFPWRVAVISSEDRELADNDLVYCLATPADPGTDFSWVKPGKVAWDWWNDWNIRGVDFKSGVNTATYRYYIDFAAEYNIPYVILDEGWAVNGEADLFQVVPEIDLEELVAYAGSRNVGIILWAGYLAFDRDMEKVCRHYSEMGVKGFKVDFMDRDDQEMVGFHRRAAAMTARYGLMIDFHGTYKPAGLNRTWPNVINYEGVFGLEQMKWSTSEVDMVRYDVTMPFIRMVAGPVDYTQGAMRNATRENYFPVNSEPMSQGTRCRQLAEFVVFESPLCMLCDTPSNYRDEPECTSLIASMPTVWDETKVLDGKVGEYIVTARRSGDYWYVGGMTDWSPRDIDIILPFPAGTAVEIYCDGANADRIASDWKKVCTTVPGDGTVRLHMAPGGGFVIRTVQGEHGQ